MGRSRLGEKKTDGNLDGDRKRFLAGKGEIFSSRREDLIQGRRISDFAPKRIKEVAQ